MDTHIASPVTDHSVAIGGYLALPQPATILLFLHAT